METVQAAHVLAVAAGLAAEAGRVGAVLLGELVAGDDDVAVEVGDGHLGGGDEVEVVLVDIVHLALLVGELACAVARCLVHHIGRLNLQVAGLGGAVEEELDEGALELGAFADVDGEAGAGDFHAQVKVDDVVFLAEVPVGHGVGGEVGHRTARLLDHIVGGAGAGGHALVGDVGHAEQDVANLCLTAAYLVGKSLLLGFERGHEGLDFLGLFLLTGLHQLADFGGMTVELGGGIVALQLSLTALFVEGKHLIYSIFAVKTLDSQTLYDELGVLFYLLKCKHCCFLVFVI